MKNYLWERGTQLSDGGKGKKKGELFDIFIYCSNEADPTSCLCWSPQELLEEKLQTSQGKFLVPKILDAWMHNLCNFPEFSFGVHVQPGQAWPKFLIVII